MRVEAYGHMAGAARAKPKTKASGSAFSLNGSGGASDIESSSQVDAQQAVNLGALLSLQISGGETVERRAARAGKSMLDELQNLQSSLLSIDEAPEALHRMKQRLSEIQMTGDEMLDPILREIDLRARVELAKRGL
ncbi:MAG: flagellar assembly protein FliX [Hyphomicrobiales bacterium]